MSICHYAMYDNHEIFKMFVVYISNSNNTIMYTKLGRYRRIIIILCRYNATKVQE